MPKITVPSNLDSRLYQTLRLIVEQLNRHQDSVLTLEKQARTTAETGQTGLTPSTTEQLPFSSEI